ncbi:DUF1620-domain-containing protein [Vararia minispora EC-137]|uniref:DUF1620-domain-containing protein n=1 Tax=Vararia minispora EC-137 TaxID=1314806 RepID=A0ACB8QMU4_9AGAM|nr:DUF1620-domain-containing protein [Vararia minispora EC-137]
MRWPWLFIGLAAVARALHESEAGIIDWHKSFIGVPNIASISTAPSFHAQQGRPPAEALLITSTASNVLAALHASDGSIAWRYIYEPDDNIVYYKRNQSTIVSLSGPGGATLRIFECSTGHLLAETRLHKPAEGLLQDPSDFGTAVAFAEGEGDAYVLTNNHVVRRVDAAGDVQWTWMSPDQTALVAYSCLIATPSALYVVGLAKSFASYTLHITALSPTLGTPLVDAHIPSSIATGPTDLLIFTSPPSVVWLENGAAHRVQLEPSLKEKPGKLSGREYVSVVDVGLESSFVGVLPDGSASVISLTESGANLWTFPESGSSDRYTDSVFVGAKDGQGRPYIARVFWSNEWGKASAHVYAPHLAGGLVSGFTFPFQTLSHGTIVHAAVHVAYVKETDLLPYVVLTTSTGTIELWQGDRMQWTREEGLSRVRMAEMIELPERLSEGGQKDRAKEGFVERVLRHAVDAQHLPQYLAHFFTRFATGSYESAASPVLPSEPDTLTRDPFGFRKIIVAATDLGTLYALDSRTGTVLWKKLLSDGSNEDSLHPEPTALVLPAKLFVLRTAAEGGPEVVLVAQRKMANGPVDTVVFHVEAVRGRDKVGKLKEGAILKGEEVIQGAAIESFLVDAQSRFVLFLDQFRQVYIYPNTEDSRSDLASLLPSLHVPLRTGTPGSAQITGHTLQPALGFDGRALAQPSWTTSLSPGESILSIVKRPQDPIASPGRVLGNRTTLYKLLSPHLFAVTSSSSSSCSIRVLDGVKGSVMYHAVLPTGRGESFPGREGSCDVKAIFVENWLVYIYWDPEGTGLGEAKGQRIVSVEFYEGQGPDDKIGSEGLSSFVPDALRVSMFERAFVFPHRVSAITTTRTTFGVTSKDLIVANEADQIQSFPRVLLNPRRTHGKPTAEQQEEMLVPYDPLVPDDPRRIVSHRYRIANVHGIVTSPALLESTSLVFAYGLDLFGSRVAPSKTFDVLSESFNKAQLVLTVAGLAVAIIVAKPAVGRKRLRERWYRP